MFEKHGWKSIKTTDDFENIEVYEVSNKKEPVLGRTVDFLDEGDGYYLATVEGYEGFFLVKNSCDKAAVAWNLVVSAHDYENEYGTLHHIDDLDTSGLLSV